MLTLETAQGQRVSTGTRVPSLSHVSTADTLIPRETCTIASAFEEERCQCISSLLTSLPCTPTERIPSFFLLLPFASCRFRYQTSSMPRGWSKRTTLRFFFPPSILETMPTAWCSSSLPPSPPPLLSPREGGGRAWAVEGAVVPRCVNCCREEIAHHGQTAEQLS